MEAIELVLTSQSGANITTSNIIAEVFMKNHADVLRDIRNLHCSVEFRQCNFAECLNTIELNTGQSRQKYYEITKDGFSFLVMGYTGERAGEFKEKFIKEFNKRDALLKNDDFIISRAFTVLSERTKKLEFQLQKKDEETKALETQNQIKEQVIVNQNLTIRQQAPKVLYHDQVLQSHSLIATTVIAKELGMSAMALNRKLRQLGVIYPVNDSYALYSKYQGKGYEKYRTVPYVDDYGIERTARHLYWTEEGRKFILHLIRPEMRKAM